MKSLTYIEHVRLVEPTTTEQVPVASLPENPVAAHCGNESVAPTPGDIGGAGVGGSGVGCTGIGGTGCVPLLPTVELAIAASVVSAACTVMPQPLRETHPKMSV